MKGMLGRYLMYLLLVALVFTVFCVGAFCENNPKERMHLASHFWEKGEEKPGFKIKASNSSATLSQQPANCEDALHYLDFGVGEVRKLKDTYFIIIARPGKREKSGRLSQVRLNIIERSYLKRFTDIKYVTAVGSRTKGLGQIEIYVGGKLWHVLPIEKNAKTFCPEPI
jgi:hypothetical protein